MVGDFFRTIRKVVFHILGIIILLLTALGALLFIFAERPINFSEKLSDLSAIPIILAMGAAMGVCTGWGISTRYHIPAPMQVPMLLLGGIICGAVIMALIATLFMGATLIEKGVVEPSGLGGTFALVLYAPCALGAVFFVGWSFLWAPLMRDFYDFE